MASQRDLQHLKKVGLEGFALIDEYYGRTARSNQVSQRLQCASPEPLVHQIRDQSFHYQVHPQQSYVCQVPKVYSVTKEAVTTYPATSHVQYYSISERPQISVAKESIVSSNEAARLYGGKIVINYSKTKPIRPSYY